MLNSFQHLTASLYLPPSLGEILKQVNFVQYAHARHSQASLALLSLNRNFQTTNWLACEISSDKGINFQSYGCFIYITRSEWL